MIITQTPAVDEANQPITDPEPGSTFELEAVIVDKTGKGLTVGVFGKFTDLHEARSNAEDIAGLPLDQVAASAEYRSFGFDAAEYGYDFDADTQVVGVTVVWNDGEDNTYAHEEFNVSTARAEPNIGQVVTFDDQWDETIRMVATYVPGSVDEDGEFISCDWVDSYGGTWDLDHINNSRPEIVVPGVADARAKTIARGAGRLQPGRVSA
ncbi:hypothetical protein [Leifsonia sp. Leaf264]|uniref:hypothetical protein n=1 Tax=Leifsonia sp. Leaf264 TaxID=1736314 RepID=UPI0006F5C0B1|nr:hypothetical protein [Leifsonia sp. Leaf264]KQO98587.1 hypothetical protein ASF30_11030 [Leifsonia sp. Leaf264]